MGNNLIINHSRVYISWKIDWSTTLNLYHVKVVFIDFLNFIITFNDNRKFWRIIIIILLTTNLIEFVPCECCSVITFLRAPKPLSSWWMSSYIINATSYVGIGIKYRYSLHSCSTITMFLSQIVGSKTSMGSNQCF